MSTSAADTRHIHFVADGIDIRTAQGVSLKKHGSCTLPLGHIRLMLQNDGTLGKFLELWPREAGMNTDHNPDLKPDDGDKDEDEGSYDPADVFRPQPRARANEALQLGGTYLSLQSGDLLWLFHELLQDQYPAGGVLDAGNPTIIPGTDSVWTRLLAFLQNPMNLGDNRALETVSVGSDDDKEDEYPDQWSLADSSWAFSDEQTAESEAPSDTTRQGSANEHESIASQYRSTPPPYSIEDEGDDGNDLDMSDTPRQSTTRHGALSLRSSSSYAVPTKRDTEYSSGEQSSESDYIRKGGCMKEKKGCVEEDDLEKRTGMEEVDKFQEMYRLDTALARPTPRAAHTKLLSCAEKPLRPQYLNFLWHLKQIRGNCHVSAYLVDGVSAAWVKSLVAHVTKQINHVTTSASCQTPDDFLLQLTDFAFTTGPWITPWKLATVKAGVCEANSQPVLQEGHFSRRRERMELQELNLDILDPSLISFLLSEQDAQADLWVKLLETPMLVTDDELEEMFSLRLSTRDTPKPEVGQVIYYVRSLAFEVREL
ncbi:hypothetical protein PMZ80_004307 [Knufia obscura]|nr:hypothetical protein PMZ80_004307 [Knufia obscura]